MSKTAKFTEMTKGTAEDYVPIVEAAMVHTCLLYTSDAAEIYSV